MKLVTARRAAMRYKDRHDPGKSMTAGTKGIAILCDMRGIVSECLRDELGLASKLPAGVHLECVAEDAAKNAMHAFFDEMRRIGAAFDREIWVSLGGAQVSLQFSGAIVGDKILVVAAHDDGADKNRSDAPHVELLARERQARRAAVEAGRYYRSLFESAPGCYLVLSPDDFEIVAVSDAYLNANRRTRDELSGRKLFDVFPGNPASPDQDAQRILRESFRRVTRDRRADVMPVQLYPVPRAVSGGTGFEDRYWSPINSPVSGPDGQLAYIIHRVEDVTDCLSSRPDLFGASDGQAMIASPTQLLEADIVLRGRQIEEANRRLEESQALLRMASRVSRLGAWTIELPERKLSWTEEVYNIHEVPRDYVPALEDGMAFFAPEHREVMRAAFAACESDGTNYDLELLKVSATGRQVWVRTIGEAVRGPSGEIVRLQGAIQDISERKEAEIREDALRNQLTRMLERIGEGFIALDRNWRVTFLNSEAERVLRVRRDEVVGQSLWQVFPDAVGSRFQQEYERALEDGVAVKLVEYFAPLKLWADVRVYPSAEGLALYFRDVTRERVLEEQFLQSQRLESVGQLTGGVAHDFNNLLTVILGNAELLNDHLDQEPRLKPLAQMIASAAQRGAELTRALIAFARRQPLEPKSVDVNELVANMQGLLRRALGETIEIEYRPADGLKPALVDPMQLESAVLNLCLNASDAMMRNGRLTIETGERMLDSDLAGDTRGELVPGSYVVVAVSDRGCGIPADDLPKIFEPFFTTKEQGKGTGLGMSMVYGFVKQSGGQVTVYSEPGEGTTVRMYLPLATPEDTAAVSGKATEMVLGGNETILLVEDDALVRHYAQHQLLSLGYRVVEAANGPEALEMIQEGEHIDLLFTDIVMPGGMNGKQLADALSILRPGMKILFTSGYTENAVVHHGRLDAGVQLLSKPYRRSELADRIRNALDLA